MHTKALTLRGLKPELARAIERRAQESKTSLSGAVLAFLEEAAGLSKKRRAPLHDLDRFAGAWSVEEGRAFDKSLSRERRLDPELWK